MLQLNTPILATYGMLTATLACLWLPGVRPVMRNFWLVPLLLAIVLGLHYGFLKPVALVSISAFGLVCTLWRRSSANRLLHGLSGSAVLLLAGALFLHLLPGFANPKVFVGLKLSTDAYPYTKYFNFDSAMVGLGILGFGHRRLSGSAEWTTLLKQAAPGTLLTLTAVMLFSLGLGYVHWQPKWTPLFFVWAWGNLFFTCIAEEAFFRGFIQQYLMQGLSGKPGGTAIALSITAVLFGLAHLPGGIDYVMLATVAGIGYGWSYYRTGHIEAAILTHFTLNALHFLLFTYPVLAAVFN